MAETKKSPQSIVRTIYMYLVCLVAVVTFIVGSISALNVTLKYYVFDLRTSQWDQSPELTCKDAYAYPGKPVDDVTGKLKTPLTEEEIAECIKTTTEKQLEQGKKEALSTLAWALSALLISLPIWAYHWRFIKK